MSNWPDHTPDPDERGRWRGWVIPIALIAGAAIFAPRDTDWFGTFAMPDIVTCSRDGTMRIEPTSY